MSRPGLKIKLNLQGLLGQVKVKQEPDQEQDEEDEEEPEEEPEEEMEDDDEEEEEGAEEDEEEAGYEEGATQSFIAENETVTTETPENDNEQDFPEYGGPKGEGPYICDVCNKGFYDRANLRRHKRLHTGEKPYICPICNTRFSRSDVLKMHMRTHQDDAE